jgi:GAF domain-containing protein
MARQLTDGEARGSFAEPLPEVVAARLERLADRVLRLPVTVLPVAVGARPFAVTDARTHPLLRDQPAARELGVVACAGVPLFDGLEPIGAFCAYVGKPHMWTERELEAINDLAAIAQSEIGLRAATRSARSGREDAESASDVLTKLTQLTDAARAAAGRGDLLEVLAAEAASVFGAQRAVIDVLDEQGGPPRGADVFALSVLAGGEARSVADATRSALGAPLVVAGDPIGVIVLSDRPEREWSRLDAQLLELAGERLAVAIAQERVNDEHRRIADTLQRALLPMRLPCGPGLRLAGRYRPAEHRIGGDWYDAFKLGDGRFGLAVGDVVGHGIGAAAAAVRLRHFLRGYVLRGHGPGAVAGALSRLVEHEPAAAYGSMVYAELDPASGVVRWASAGHPPPVRMSGGAFELLMPAGGSLLGAAKLDPWPEREDRLAPGDRLVLYTDGLVEQPGEAFDDGIDATFGAVEGVAADPEAIADALLAAQPDPGRDDAAVLIAALDAV